MQTRELIEDLKRLLSVGQDGDKGRHMFILFGIKYAAEIEAEIEACGESPTPFYARLAKSAINKPVFGREIAKGVKLARHVRAL